MPAGSIGSGVDKARNCRVERAFIMHAAQKRPPFAARAMRKQKLEMLSIPETR